MTELDLLVVGDVNPDVIVAGGDVMPRFGQAEQLVDRGVVVVGGSAAITACGAARLGLAVGLCGVVGDDPLGELMLRELTASGVAVSDVPAASASATGLSVILDRGGDRAIITSRGSMAALGAEQLTALGQRPARHVHVASYFLMSAELRAELPNLLSRWRASGVTTSIDTNWDPSEEWRVGPVLAEIDVFLPNFAELLAVTGATSAGEALASPLTRGCDVVAKRGEAGAVAVVGGDRYTIAALPPPFFGDAIGAGDSFDAGYLAGRLTGDDVEDSLRLAVAVGTLSTRGVGGTQAQPHRAEARSWGAELVVTGPHREGS